MQEQIFKGHPNRRVGIALVIHTHEQGRLKCLIHLFQEEKDRPNESLDGKYVVQESKNRVNVKFFAAGCIKPLISVLQSGAKSITTYAG